MGLSGGHMVELPPNGVDVAVEVGRIAAAPGSIADRAKALLEPLHRVFPFEGAWIGLLDPERRAHLSLVQQGHEDRLRAYLDGPQILEEMELVGIRRSPAPMRLRDLPVPVAESPTWAEYMWPAGFRDGVGVGLFSPDGRYMGVLGLHTDTPAQLTDAARDLIGLLAPTIAAAVDPMRSIAVVAGMVGNATAGIVLTRASDSLPLPGLASHLLLVAGSPVLAVAAAQRAGQAVASFLWPYQDRDSADRQVRITVLACPAEIPDYLSAVVLVSPPGDLHGLTPRELQVLGLLVEGWSNPRIAARLVISDHTVITHVEHILAKLAVPTRIAAAAVALRLGLYVPRLLAPVGTE
ncbi:MAG: LuxR C-terminal-related transcriptional regulator [Gaiellaceae bacterium]